ncbi:MAG TPA: MmgE/PrpD family protein [Gaiellaceae bacterium]
MDGLSTLPRAPGAARLAEWALALRPDEIPAAVREAAKLHLVDALGCGLAASALGIATEGRTIALEQGGRGEATVIGGEAAVPAASAALANGMLCHALDFDDTHADSVCHVSVVVVPAALAAAEAAHVAGAELLTAVVAGTELVARIGMAASGAFHARGFHPTSICGVFGAAAVAARLSGLDARTATSALGLAGSAASGLFAYLDDGTPTKPVHAGLAAQAGLVAARLAALGAEGPPSVLEARFGVYRAFADADADTLDDQLDDLGERWETPRSAFKKYPCCHYSHGSLGATARLVAEHRPDPARIREIEVSVPPGPAASLVLEPTAEKQAPRTTYEAKFSLQYSTAALLVTGRLDVETYTDAALRDPAVLALAQRVRYRVRDFGNASHAFPGGVRIVLDDGSELAAELAFQEGAPENPLGRVEVEAKFRANARPALGDAGADELLLALRDLDGHDDLHAALAPLRRPAGR